MKSSSNNLLHPSGCSPRQVNRTWGTPSCGWRREAKPSPPGDGQLTFAKGNATHENHQTCNFMMSSQKTPEAFWTHLGPLNKSLQEHGTSKHLISEVTSFISTSRCRRNRGCVSHLRSVWQALVGKYEIHVDNLYR